MQVPVVRALETRLGGLTTGLYVGGSVATGDYRAGVSDIDVVALMAGTPDRATRRLLAGTHRELVAAEPDGAALHCVYVPSDRAQDPTRRHWTWAFEELFRRPLSGIARAELLADPVIVSGPPPATWLPAMGPDDVRGAAAAELSGYWSRVVRKPALWRQDTYVDHGTTTLARADITIAEGRLATKREAIGRRAELGLPADIVDGIGRRRRGERTPLTAPETEHRAVVVRAFMRRHLARLLDDASRPSTSTKE